MPLEINGVEYADEQLAEMVSKFPELEKSYKKLESEFTKTSQGKKELEAQAAQLKAFHDEWGQFAQEVGASPALAQALVETYNNVRQNNVTEKDKGTLQTALRSAQKTGDDDAVKELREQLNEVRAQLNEQKDEREIADTFSSLEARAKSDNLDGFTLDGYKEFASKWLEEELGIGDDDDVTPRDFRSAYAAYKAHLLSENIQRGKVPNVRSDSAGAPPTKPGTDKRTYKERQRDRLAGALSHLGKNL